MRQLLIYLSLVLFISTGTVWAQNTSLTGTITDKTTSEPMIGVTVLVKGTTIGTVTNYDGVYNLQVPDNTEMLVYSFIGYQTQEVAYTGQSVINIQLQDDSENLDEVVVTGYGIQKKGTYTGSVEVVSAEKIEQVPVASFDQALQGRAPGVVSVGSSGRPGAAATVRIRGVSSINAGNDPLYIMDGIPITAGQFSALNQNDIENVSILKDATATSLYGSRASNGVIVITTKRGKSDGRTSIQYRGQFGLNTIARDNFNMMNTAQKIQYEEELGLKTYTPEEKLDLMKTNTNWFDVVLRDALTQSHELSARGGNENTRFYMSGGYYFQEGIQYRSDFERFTYRLNLDNKVSDRANLGVNLSFGYESNNNTVSGGAASTNVYNPIFAARLLNPYLAPYTSDGSYNNEGFPFANPIEQIMLNENKNNTLKIVGGVFFDVELAKNLVFKTNLGADFYDYRSYGFLHPDSEWGRGFNGKITEGFRRNFRLTPTNTLRYKFQIAEKHDFNVLAGQEIISNTNRGFSVGARNIPTDKLRVLAVASEIDGWGGDGYDYTVASFFGNMAYSYNYKYLADLSIRRDGSSRFGVDNRWGTFWSAGLGWNIQEEEFIKGIGWIDQLKVRASVGETGNYNIGNYEHQALYGYTTYIEQSAAFYAQAANDELTWERKFKANVALEMAFLRKYRAKVDFYSETTKDMLFVVPRSITTGIGGRLENIGEMNNKGFEVELDGQLIQKGDFGFHLNANLSYNLNRVTKLYNNLEEIDQGYTKITLDQPLGTFYMARWAGVDESTGKGLWYTADGEVTDTYSDAHRVLLEGKTYLPPLTGGFTGTFSYKSLQLSAFFSWMADKWLINNTRFFTESHGMFASYNQSADLLDYWKQPGDKAKHPNPEYQDNEFDTRLLENASFLRLKNLTLSYNLNKNFVQKTMFFNSCRVYAQGQNLLTFTGYKGIDPEFYGVMEANMYPHVRTITLGIDLGF
ncbi:SusC/RagA family TonB-linked outer membrane protein [Carboxylicivirga linearis]|uniref:TonB-dependent receptor n=1 Tax=Carboxylicivirga linearis TaxID=1628157 RepID=A0ABS5K104_9BACT|nr:TonB-dependent receptor [Carboxylicivirga linearis]MBS2100374.1 TonB-dependent receptor [Carboxylicivirga linearis]